MQNFEPGSANIGTQTKMFNLCRNPKAKSRIADLLENQKWGKLSKIPYRYYFIFLRLPLKPKPWGVHGSKICHKIEKKMYSPLSKDFLRLAADDFFNGSDIKVAITGNGGHNWFQDYSRWGYLVKTPSIPMSSFLSFFFLKLFLGRVANS